MVKKMVGLLLGATLLVGCGATNQDEDTTEMDVSVDTTIVEDTSEEVDTSVDTSSVDTSDNGSAANSNLEDNHATGILFVPQQSDIEAGFTVENDEALGLLEQLVIEAGEGELGIEDDVAVHFTGLYLDHAEPKDAIFLIVNRTDMAMTNVDFSLSFGTADGEMIMEQNPVQLPEDSFGILEPNTAMPLYITVDPSKEELLLELIETRNETLSIDGFTFQEINSETQDISDAQGNGRGTGSSGTNAATNMPENGVETNHGLVLVPQVSDIEQGFTVETDSTLSQLQQIINQTEEVGIEGDIAIHNSGLYLEHSEGVSAVFIIVNRTGIAMSDIQMDVSFSTADGTVFLDEKAYHLREDSFGVLESETVMPLYFDIPQELTEEFLAIEDFYTTVYSIDSFDYVEK